MSKKRIQPLTQMPSLRHSREVYAKFVMDGEEYRSQVLKNIIYTVDLSECSVRQLILPDLPPQEKLYYYQKAAALLETVLDGKYAGCYDPPLLYDYYEMAILYANIGQAEKVEEFIGKLFPQASILRMDLDTTSKKGSMQKIIDDFGNLKYDILLGTQIVAKGLDFSNVTLVGVINADTSLNIPDFRSSENTFSLLSQVAGRSGRSEKSGEVIIQTYKIMRDVAKK